MRGVQFLVQKKCLKKPLRIWTKITHSNKNWIPTCLFHPIQDNIVLNQMHFIGYDYRNRMEKGIKKALKKFGCTSAILSKIHLTKYSCITKEKHEEMYKTNEESETRMDLSVGEDLETFIERIKNGEINKDTITENGEIKGLFLLCLLGKEERKKLEQKNIDFLETFVNNEFDESDELPVDVPEAEWKASESNLKFARSMGLRSTYFIDASIISSDSDSDSGSDLS